MKRFSMKHWLSGVLSLAMLAGPAWGRGFGGGGFHGGGGFGGGGFHGGGGGFGGGGFHGGGNFGGGGFNGGNFGGGGRSFQGGGNFGGGNFGGGGHSFPGGGNFGGGGLSGSGFRPSVQPQTFDFNRGGSGGLGNGGFSRPDAFHQPGMGGNNFGLGNRPEIGGNNRPEFGGGNRPEIGGNNLPGAGLRPDAGMKGNISLPGLGPSRPGSGGSGTRRPFGDHPGGSHVNNGLRPGQDGRGQQFPGMRPGQNGSGTANRFNPGNPNSIPDRHENLVNQFDRMQDHWGDSDWHHQQWNGPNGGEVNHIGYWGPNGYWGHTGAWGPNGGHWGHSTGIGPNGAYSRTTGIGPNGAVWGHGGAIGPNGAFGYSHYAGPAGHWSRNWGGWYNGYAPCWGNGRWNYLWNTYPVAMGFGATMWGINAVSWAFGVSGYYNPYYDTPVYVNNQPIITYNQPIVGDSGSAQTASVDQDDSSADSQKPDPLTEQFDQARQAFFNEQYDQALQLTDQALALAPRDAAINEFRSLCLFALGRYRESAATIHAVLAAGPGWDWTTMISLYSNSETYTSQLRKLESYVQANPDAADAQFLLAYHYLTTGHTDDAVTLLKSVVQLQPKDNLSAQLIQMYSPPSADPPKTTDTKAPDLEKPAYPMEKLYGDWTATHDDGTFSLHLGENDEFTWKFTRDGQPQSVSGAYAIRGQNLVMQPDSGGTMISTITLKNDKSLEFVPIENGTKLTFKR